MTTTAVPVTYEFDEDFQLKVAAMALRDTKFVIKTDGLIKPEYFTNEAHAAIVSVALDYFRDYRKAPAIGVIGAIVRNAIAAKRIRSDIVGQVKTLLPIIFSADISDSEFVAAEVSRFARHKAIENAIMDSVPLLESGKYDEISGLIGKANLVGLSDEDFGVDYYEDIERRTKERLDSAAGLTPKTGITSGYEEIDKQLYHHGWGRKELSCIMGGAKAGKSMSLGEFAKNASLAGYNVLLVTCEVSAAIIVDRLDTNISQTLMTGLKASAKTVAEKVEELKKKHPGYGKFLVREYPSGRLKASQLRRLIERCREHGIKFDLIVVDYADIMAPEKSYEDFREGSRQIYLDLREIAFEEDAAVLTATQTNRDGMKSMSPNATHVAEDINKARTVDVMISIVATEAERAAGEARLIFTLNRNGPSDVTVVVQQDRKYLKFLKKVLRIE
jgi:replicative DNA helicase